MFGEAKIQKWASHFQQTHNLPLRLRLWNGQQFDLGQFATPAVTLTLKRPNALRYVLTPSLSNLAEAYIQGEMDVEGSAHSITEMAYRLASASLPSTGKWGRITRMFTHNKQADAQAIQYHYDVSNDFYAQWLDPSMVYSCAYFENGDETLDAAQYKKIDHILTKIKLQPGQTLLDIGCGWGALVIRAAQKFGAQCVGITLSHNQAALARERVAALGLQNKIEIRLQDYRDTTGQFDRITSVGMFEHVGIKHLSAYFARMRELLADNGLAMNHGITTSDAENGETAYGGGEFIEKYVFPHGELPHIGLVLKTMQQGGLEVLDVENLRRHYAHTLNFWAENYDARTAEIKAELFKKNTPAEAEKRYRIWRIYLAGCANAFEQDQIALFQVVCAKAGQSAQQRAWSRRYMYL